MTNQFVTKVTLQVPHVGQELYLTFGNNSVHPQFLVGFVLLGLLVFCVMFCRALCVNLSFFFWPLYCIPFFNLRLLIPLVSSNLSYGCRFEESYLL